MAESQHYTLRIDGPLLRKQREALLDTLALKFPEETCESLEGLIALLDEIADQAHDRYGIDCLLQGGETEQVPCECEQPGYFYSGVPGIIAHLEDGLLPKDARVERCDLCQRYPSDEAALQKLAELGHVQP